MKCARLYGKKDVRIDQIPVPLIGPDELLVKVKAASICGSDIRMIQNGYPGVGAEAPLTLGHEFAGIIKEVGSLVKSYEKGMRVSTAPNWGCGICDMCVGGNTHLCQEYQAFGINRPGGFAEYVVIPAPAIAQGNLAVLSERVSFAAGAVAEPLSCVLNGQEQAGVHLGDIVFVIGAGPIGIMHAMLAEIQGAAMVIMHDLQKKRLAAAKQIMPTLVTVEANPEEALHHLTGGKMADICIIAAPAPAAQEASLNYLSMNGKTLFFGGLPKDREQVQLNSNTIHYKQNMILGSARSNIRQYRTGLKLIEYGRLPIHKLITGRFTIDCFLEAAAAAEHAEGLKNIIVFED